MYTLEYTEKTTERASKTVFCAVELLLTNHLLFEFMNILLCNQSFNLRTWSDNRGSIAAWVATALVTISRYI